MMDGQTHAALQRTYSMAEMPVPGWLLLSDRDQPLIGLPEGRLDAGLLVIELAWPLASDVLLDWRDSQGAALSLFHDRARGLVLLWREGRHMTRHVLPGPLWAEGRLARLFFSWNRAEGIWSLRLDDGAERVISSTCGCNPVGFPALALAALCAGRGTLRRDPAVLWFGVTPGRTPPARMPWIGRATPVPTPAGPLAAGLLQPGDWILTRDEGPIRLRSIRHLDMPSRGSHAAVVLRAPYFARKLDLLVSADQMVTIIGPEAEYLFGEDEVLVPAGALVDGRIAMTDNRRATTPCVSLDLGAAHLIDSNGCAWMTGHHGSHVTRPIAPLRSLQEYEARPLIDLLRRMRPNHAA